MSEPMDVVCRACGGRYHETTELFDPSVAPDGSMFRLKDHYRQIQPPWDTFNETEITYGANLCCPWCENEYPDQDGNVRVEAVEPEPEPEQKEPYEDAPPMFYGFDTEKLRKERGKNRSLAEIREDVEKLREENPDIGWKELYDTVDHPYGELPAFRKNVEGKTTRSDPNYRRKQYKKSKKK